MEQRCNKETEISTIQEQVKTIFHRLDKYEKTQDALYDLSKSVAVIAKEMTHIGEDVKEVKQEVSEVKTDLTNIKNSQNTFESKQDKEDAKMWKEIKKYVFFAFLGAVITYLLSTLGGL